MSSKFEYSKRTRTGKCEFKRKKRRYGCFILFTKCEVKVSLVMGWEEIHEGHSIIFKDNL